jgi:hypothetical protein
MLIMHKWCWCKSLKCVVEVIKRGHFPTTAVVRLPNDSEVEVDISELEDTHGDNPRSEG